MDVFGVPLQDSPSLADVVVGVTARAVVALLGDGEAASAFPKVQAYLQRLGKIKACMRGAVDVGTFTKVSPRNLRLGVSTCCPYSQVVGLVVCVVNWTTRQL